MTVRELIAELSKLDPYSSSSSLSTRSTGATLSVRSYVSEDSNGGNETSIPTISDARVRPRRRWKRGRGTLSSLSRRLQRVSKGPSL